MPAPLQPGDRVYNTHYPRQQGTVIETSRATSPSGEPIDFVTVQWTPATIATHFAEDIRPVDHKEA